MVSRGSDVNKNTGKSRINLVFQNQRIRGGVRSTHGAERLKRRITVQKNSMYRGGAKRKEYEKLARDYVKSKFDALAEPTLDDLEGVVSAGVDRRALIQLLELDSGPSDSATACCAQSADCDSDSIMSVLKDSFGFSDFRGAQKDAIVQVLNKQDTLTVMPTGSGKSLIYQFPSAFWRTSHSQCSTVTCVPLTVVVSPLVALMANQIEVCPVSVRACLMHSNVSPPMIKLLTRGIQHGLIDLVYVAPERLSSQRFLSTDLGRQIGLVAIDEVHCLSQWSHTFRPSYGRVLHSVTKNIRPNCVLGLTATATLQVQQHILDLMRELGRPAQIQSFWKFPSHIEYTAVDTGCHSLHGPPSSAESISQVISSLSTVPQLINSKSILIYVKYRYLADCLAAALNSGGFGPAAAYHAGMDAAQRQESQKYLFDGTVRILVATIAFGLGVHQENISAVIHVGLPGSIEAYMQETGRCREKLTQVQNFSEHRFRTGFSLMLFSFSDLAHGKQLLLKDSVCESSVKDILERIKTSACCTFPSGETCVAITETGSQSTYEKPGTDKFLLILNSIVNSIPGAHVYYSYPVKISLRSFQAATVVAILDAAAEGTHDAYHHVATCLKRVKHSSASGTYSFELTALLRELELDPGTAMARLEGFCSSHKLALDRASMGHLVCLPYTAMNDLSSEKIVIRVARAFSLTMRANSDKIDAVYLLGKVVSCLSTADESSRVLENLVKQYTEAGTASEFLKGYIGGMINGSQGDSFLASEIKSNIDASTSLCEELSMQDNSANYGGA